MGLQNKISHLCDLLLRKTLGTRRGKKNDNFESFLLTDQNFGIETTSLGLKEIKKQLIL